MARSFLRAAQFVAASTMALAAGAVHAQDRPTDPAEIVDEKANDIIVTGTRSALQSAEDFKRESDVLVDGISADDIGALPDESIADSLVRIPGLTANDNDGGFAEVSVRGLGSDLANTTYNGRVLPSTRFNNRRLNLGDLPTEGISRAFVQKTADAGTIEGGLGGTIGLESIRPLETRRSGFTIVARGITDDLTRKVKGIDNFKRFGYRGEVSYVGRLADNLGITFSYAHIEQTNANPSATLEAYANKTNLPTPDVDGDGLLEVIPQNAGVALGINTQKRDSILAAVQWRPVPSLTATLDGYYVKGGGSASPTRFIANLIATTTQVPTVLNVENSVINQYQGFAGNYREVLNDSRTGTEQYQGGLNLRLDNGGPFKVNFDVSYAYAKTAGTDRSAVVLTDATNAAQTAPGQARPVGFDARDPKNITLNFGTQTADDFAINELTINRNYSNDTAKAVRLDFVYDQPLAIFGTMEFGLRADTRIKRNAPNADNYAFGTLAQRPDLDDTYLASATNPFDAFQDYIGGPGAIGFPLFDINKLFELATNPRAVLNTQPVNDVTGRSTITEDTLALYYQANLDIGRRLTGSIGARYLVTDVNVEGFATTLAAPSVTPLRVKNNYSYLLPSANLRYAITRQLIARAAASETMSRPVFSAQRIGSNIDYSSLVEGNTISRGNPNLKPFTSRNYDLSLEWYPNRRTSLAVQGYYKQVKNFIQNQIVEQLVTLPSGDSVFLNVNTNVNDPTQREFYGIEVIARRDFDFLPGALRFFGVRLDYSHNWTTAIDTFGSANGQQATLKPNNFTAEIANVQLYYSRPSYDMRLAYRYYSPYTRDITNGYQSRPGGTLDLTGNVRLFRNIRAIGSIRNLTKTKTYTNFADYRYPDNYGFARNNIYSGRQFTFGTRAQF